jgi:chemotaxis protein histidine kinase CheA
MLGGLCNVLAAALSAARKATALVQQVDELTRLAHERETTLSQAQAQLQSSRDELRQLGAQIEALRRGARSADPVVLQREALRPTPPGPARASLPAEPDSGHLSRRTHFFEQAAAQLEQFDEARGRLAISSGDPSALSALVQAAHTLRDKSATMGYNTLAKLAGTLAEALRRAQADRLRMTPDMLALAGESASALRALLADVRADRPPSLDATPLLNRLVLSQEARGAEEMTRTSAGAQMLIAEVRIRRDTPLKPARAMMVLMQIKRVGQIVACQPVEADLRSGGFEDEFTVRFTTTSKPDVVRAALSAIPDVTSVDVNAVRKDS